MTGTAPVVPGERRLHSAGGDRSGKPPPRLVLLGATLLVLGGVLGFSISRELGPSNESAQVTASARASAATRPALSADEQAYVDALWPIHTDVEVAAERVALGTIFYTTNDLERAELQSRLDEALATYRSADGRLQALHPPSSLRRSHDNYVAAVGLFEQSTLEMLRMFDDGDEGHLQTAYPTYQDGTNRIRDLGGKFWPDEFPPN